MAVPQLSGRGLAYWSDGKEERILYVTQGYRLVALDDSIGSVTLAGAGPDYSSGGDLDEFGTFPDPATAHLVRLTASIARVLADLGLGTRPPPRPPIGQLELEVRCH